VKLPTAVVWDVGHVLYDWDPRYLFAKLIPDRQELDWFLSHVVTKAWHFQSDAGRPIATMIAELSARFPKYAELIAAYWPRWLETIPGPMPGMLDLVAELAAAKVPQFAITNFGAEFWAMFRPTAPIFDSFGDIVVSGVEKVAKPDPAIYALALARFGLAPGEGVFIDDRADNIAAADTAGLIGHVFVDAADTRAWLAEQGIMPACSATLLPSSAVAR